ncbi:hypothetical protein L3i22_059880 [Actinoplanes sp. L3-i22]|nr:hypothetical protein L3i22_059880 [Actinoplanes sp. L3-i22]
MQIDLRDQRRQAEPVLGQQLPVGPERQPLGSGLRSPLSASVERAGRAAVQLSGGIALTDAGLGVPIGPPGDQLRPAEPALAQRPVAHQAELRVLHDLDGVTDRIGEYQLGLGAVGREDQVPERGTHAALPGADYLQQTPQLRQVVLIDDPGCRDRSTDPRCSRRSGC